MQRFVTTLIVTLTLSLTAYAQNFLGGGFTSNVTSREHHQGPYLEGGAHLGQNSLGTLRGYATLYPEPGARFSINFHPSYFQKFPAKLFVGVGGEWNSLARRDDEWHSVLTAGVNLPKGFTAYASRLHLNPQGFRVGGSYAYALSSTIRVKVAADHSINRHAVDRGRLSVGLVRVF